MDAASVLILGALDKESITPQEENYFKNSSLSGVTLFKRNISDDSCQVKKINEDLQVILGHKVPALIAIDQEGGRVSRLKNLVIDQGPAMELFKDSDERAQAIFDYAKKLAIQLLAIGVNSNFAPVMDVLTEPSNTAIGDRCFGTDTDTVAKLSGAFLSGMQGQGVMGCLKHFPGQGAACADTHLQSTNIDLQLDQLMIGHITPFARYSSQAAMMMMSHCIYPKVDSLPASLSKIWQQDILRGQLGFGGVIVSDDFNMKAIPQTEVEWVEAIVEAIYAGTDLILVCQGLDKIKLAVDGIRRKAKSSPTFRSRVEESAARILKLRSLLPHI